MDDGIKRKKACVVVVNFVFVALSAIAIATLAAGSFLKLTLDIDLDGEKIGKIIDLEDGGGPDSGEGAESGFGPGGGSGAESGPGARNAGPGDGAEAADAGELFDFKAIFKEISIQIPLSFDIRSKDLIGSFSANPEETVKDMIRRETSGIIETLMSKADVLMEQAIGATINVVVDKAEKEAERVIIEEIRKAGEEATGEEITEERIYEELKSNYDIDKKDVEDLKDDISGAAKDMLNGANAEETIDKLIDNAAISKLMEVYVEQEFENDASSGESAAPGGAPTEEQKTAKIQEMKEEIRVQCSDMVGELEEQGILQEGGRFDKNAAVAKLVDQAFGNDSDAPAGAEAEPKDPERLLEDAKEQIASKLYGAIDSSMNVVGIALKILGGFVLLVMAMWALLLVKCLIKTIATSVKAVRPGWTVFFSGLPHVLFVGLPMLIIKNLGAIVSFAADKLNFSFDAGEILEMFKIGISSLSWVSAVCGAIVFALSIPYGSWRRSIKREARAARRG